MLNLLRLRRRKYKPGSIKPGVRLALWVLLGGKVCLSVGSGLRYWRFPWGLWASADEKLSLFAVQ